MALGSTEILFICLSYGKTADEKKRQLTGLHQAEWKALVEQAKDRNLAPLLYHQIKQLGLTPPGAVLQELEAAYLQTVGRNIRLYSESGKMLSKLAEHGCPVIVLKGIYLAEHAYDNIGLRPMGDVDLLVRKDDLSRIDQALLALGFVPVEQTRVITETDYHFHYSLNGKNFNVEIHWSILASRDLASAVVDNLWSRASATTSAGVPVLTLSLEDLIVYLCLHTAKHAPEGMQISMLCDIGEVIRRYGSTIQWQKVSEFARQWNLVRTVYVILCLAQELLGVPVPEDWLVSIQPEPLEPVYLDLARNQFLCPPMDREVRSQYLAQLHSQKGLGDKLRLICNRLFPSREFMAVRYPARANSWKIFLYYPARIVHVLHRFGLCGWKLLLGDRKTQESARYFNESMDLRDWLLLGWPNFDEARNAAGSENGAGLST